MDIIKTCGIILLILLPLIPFAQTNAPSQTGIINIQNNYYPEPKSREVTDSLINEITSHAPIKEAQISIFLRSKDRESNYFATKIAIALRSKGYVNTFVMATTEYSDLLISDDPIEMLKHNTEIQYYEQDKGLHIIIPGR